MVRLVVLGKFLEKLCRWNSQNIIAGISHNRNRCCEKFSESGSSTVDLAVPGSDVPVKKVEDIPGPGGWCSLPYIGSLFLFHPFRKFRPEKSNLVFEDLHQKYGSMVKFRKGAKWSVILFDPDLIETAMLLEGKQPNRPSLPLADVYSARTRRQPGISQLQGEEWAKIRRPVQEFLGQPSNVIQYVPALDEVANEMRLTISQQIQQDGSVSISNVMLRYAIESSAVYCINTRLGFQQGSTDNKSHSSNGSTCPHVTQLGNQHPQKSSTQFRQLTNHERAQLITTIKTYMESVGRGLYTFPMYKFFRTKLYKDFEQASNYLSTVVQSRLLEIGTQLKQEGQRSGGCPERTNLLQSLICDGRLDLPTCTSLLTGFLSTASDNISHSLVVLLWYLAKNKPKQEILREEITRLVPSQVSVSPDVLAHMPYLKACLKESHRLTFPTPLGSVRVLPDNVILGGYEVPAGTWLHFGHNVLGHSDKYFEKPQSYEPERWLKQYVADPIVRRQRSIIAMPFGFGPRNCVGRRLAELQIYLAVIKILQHYELSLSEPGEKLDIVYTITACPSKPLDIRFLSL